uniref:Biofilm regulator BssS n=1 Tax=Mycobacterium riyadhense TaxID=486698 RepID=A0A653EWM0_9MYCO|nr:Biofilm regulator BssS [Mycobacterium riyadhense]
MAVSALIVAVVGFWEDQVLELTRGIDALLADDASIDSGGLLASSGQAGLSAADSSPDTAISSLPIFAPADWTGPAAGAAGEATASVARDHMARAAADEQLVAALTAVQAATAHARGRLRTIRAAIDDGVRARHASMDTPAGQMEMAQFLQDKAGELLAVIRQARHDAGLQLATLTAKSVAYNA